MRIAKLVAVMGLAALTCPATAADRLFCVADKATGFKLVGDEWQITSFKVADDKFIAQRVDPSTGYDWTVTQVGKSYPYHHCKQHTGGDIVICGGLGWGFQINLKLLRYQEFYGIGYIDADAPGTPSLTIGKCSPT